MNSLSAFFCHICGVDVQLLVQCPKNEQFKYTFLGILLFLLISIAGATMLLVLLLMQGAGNDEHSVAINIDRLFSPVFLGLFWSFIVFNSYRLVISSTGYGDDSHKFTFKELFGGSPKIILALSVAIFSGFLVTVATLYSELYDQLSSIQEQYVSELNQEIMDRYDNKLEPLYQSIAELMGQSKQLEDKIAHYNNVHLSKEREALTRELNKLQDDILTLSATKSTLIDEIIHHKNANKNKLIQAQDFMSVIDKAMENNRLLFTSILSFSILAYISPIIINLTLTKSCYEYLVSFQNYIMLSKYGIAPKAHHIKINQNAVFVDRFTVPPMITKEVTRELYDLKLKHFRLNKSLEQ